MTFLALHRKLDGILSRARMTLASERGCVEVAGGLPGASRRHAYVGGVFLEAEFGESREVFEVRLSGLKGNVVLGGLPPLPGTDTAFALPDMDPATSADYWDYGGDPEPEDP